MAKVMKKLTYFLLLTTIIFISSCSSCSNKENKDKDDFDIPTEFEEHLTGKDTAEVKEMVAVFIEHLKNERYYDAAGMLYRFENDGSSRYPRLYNNEDIERFVKVHKMLPVEDYEIEYMRFREKETNEVCISIIMKRGETKDKDIKSKIFLNPIYHNNQWCLVTNDTFHGTNTVVPVTKRDSMTKVYQDQQKIPEIPPKR